MANENKIATAIIEFATDLTKYTKGVGDVEKSGEKLGQSFSKLGLSVASAFAVPVTAAGVITAVTALGQKALATADHVQALADSIGFSAEETQRMEYAAGQTGVAMESLSGAAFKLTSNIAQGTPKATAAFRDLGLSITDLQRMKPEDQFNTAMKALEGVEDQTERTRLGVDLFGKNFGSIAAAVANGYTRIKNEATVSSDAQIAALDRAGDAIDRLKGKLSTISTRFFGDTAAGILAVTDLFTADRVKVEDLTAAQKQYYDSLNMVRKEQYLIFVAEQRAAAAKDAQRAALQGATKQTADYAAQLKAAQAEIAKLTPAQKALIDAGLKLGEKQDDIANKVGLSEGALKLYIDATQKATSGTKKLSAELVNQKSDIEQHAEKWKATAKAMDEAGENAMKAAADRYTREKDLKRQLDDELSKGTRTRLEQEIIDIQRWADDQRQILQSTVEDWREQSKLITEIEEAKLRDLRMLAELERLHMKGVGDFIPGTEGGITTAIGPEPSRFAGAFSKPIIDWAGQLPGQIARAFEGGGGWAGALQAGASTLGSTLMGSLFGKLGADGKGISGLAKGLSGWMASAVTAAGPIIGALAGPLIGKIVEHFKKPEYKEIMKDVGRGWGVDISEGLAKQIEKDAKEKFGKDRVAGSLFNLSGIIGEAGGLDDGNLDTFARKLRDVFSMVDQGKFTLKQAGDILDKNWNAFVEAGTDANGRLADSLVEIIALNKQFGTQSKAIADYLKGQASSYSGSVNAIVAAAHDATDNWHTVGEELRSAQKEYDELKKSGKASADELEKAAKRLNAALADQQKNAAGAKLELADLGLQALLAYNTAIAAGMDPAAALASVQPALKTLAQAYRDLGLDIEDAGLSDLLFKSEIAESNPQLVAGIGALTQSFIYLRNSGIKPTAEQFEAMQRTASQMYLRIQGEVANLGKTGDEGTRAALQQMQGFLHEVERQAKETGLPLDENTQRLIDQSKELGVWQEAAPTAAEKTAAAMDKLGKSLDGVATKFDDIIAKLMQMLGLSGPAAAAAAAAAQGIGNGTGGGFYPEGPTEPGTKTPVFPQDEGGDYFVKAPTLFLAHPGERATFQPMNRRGAGAPASPNVTFAPNIEVRVMGSVMSERDITQTIVRTLNSGGEAYEAMQRLMRGMLPGLVPQT